MNFANTIQCPNCKKDMKGGGGDFSSMLSTSWRNCSCGMNALLFSIDDSHTLECQAVPKEKEDLMEKYLSLLNLSGIKVLKHWAITNKYHSSGQDWLLAKTDLGMIEIGWRSKVINIDWSDTGIKMIVEDEVTKDETSAHAYSYENAVNYLTKLKNRMV